ncbi:MAG: dehydrogenase [Elusimicrobia bacterium]|nr:dehydrogenase [Elusimicrobiota bacterium]
MSIEVHKRISELLEKGKSFALATIVEATAGTPRKSGTRMIVFPDSTTEFTVGGGPIEEGTILRALKALKTGEGGFYKVELKDDKCGMVCGGGASIFIEVFTQPSRILIFGGGHIGMALSKFYDVLGLPYYIFDDRPEFSSVERFPRAASTLTVSYDDPIKGFEVTENDSCVVVTHGHKGDKKVLTKLLGTSASYIGMIGSKNKVRTVLDKIRKDGIDVEDPRIHSPIGLDIGGETPEEIALSIVAEIQKVRYSRENA